MVLFRVVFITMTLNWFMELLIAILYTISKGAPFTEIVSFLDVKALLTFSFIVSVLNKSILSLYLTPYNYLY